MIVKLARALGATIAALLGIALLLVLPVLYIETSCRPTGTAAPYDPIKPEAHHRPESRTLLTYPEWHIVHAYEDYAEILREGDPHEYGFLRGIAGFWTTLCDLSAASGAHGGFPGDTKTMVYVVGVSFTAELLAKAAYEETLGRAATWLRGPEPAPLDQLSARQARDYAVFLRQVPWYRWDFTEAADALAAEATGALRDRERRMALGLEYRGKALYAEAIAAAVASTGNDALRLRMIVDRAPAPRDGLEVIGPNGPGIEVETIRYRALTEMLQGLAEERIQILEIAGNDDIMLTVISDEAQYPDALISVPRQGFGDYRHLVLLKVSDLSVTLQSLATDNTRLEHIHDY
ncbi:hypothetical protein FIU97_17720 [Roseivivax sp. THAF40]|uniref:hypothetical protein n=1 Tax=Roseivivax sp. THAF40 TaxID=2587858 RepID=UPI0012A7A502|nr:hypothetical protein [Roseivivax sp. THAF40]QFT48428.1 hypothetical protein FIU97_17720 [Roseivivax sp. THAF40]